MPEPPPLQRLSHPVGVLYEIRWREICPWLILVKALRVTLMIRVLVLAFLGVIITQWGGSAIDAGCSAESPTWFSITELPRNDAQYELPNHGEQRNDLTLMPPSTGPLFRGWRWLTQPFFRLADRKNSWQSSLALLAHGIWAIAVWAVFGGAIARIAALYMARGETIGPLVALKESIAIWLGTAGAPLIALFALIALAIPLVLLGLLLRLNLFAVIAGLFWCVALAWGLMFAVIALGLLVGWPLMWACLGVERSDAFDGVSRCYAYVYQKPLQLAFYVAIAALLALLGETIVNVFANVTVATTDWTVSWGTGNTRAAELLTTDWQTSVSPVTSRAINGWKWGFASIASSFPIACLWPMSVGIYLLMRRHVDATEMDEITLADGTAQSDLPNLKKKESGVPEVVRPATNGDASGSDEIPSDE